jgi:hypothetical protein
LNRCLDASHHELIATNEWLAHQRTGQADKLVTADTPPTKGNGSVALPFPCLTPETVARNINSLYAAFKMQLVVRFKFITQVDGTFYIGPLD